MSEPDFQSLARHTSERCRDLVEQVILKHEQSVLEVMHELKRESVQLRGECSVLAGLLRDCDAVLATIEPEDTDEAGKLSNLRMALSYALDPHKREGTLL
jgi:hypothetical protein